MVTIQSLVERLASVFGEGENKLPAMRAREEFFERAGKVFDDDGNLFEGRMASFLEWFIIERPFRDGPPPAARVAGAPDDARFTDEERRLAAHLATSSHSLFEVDKTDGGSVLEIDDLLGGARFSVTERRSTVGFEPGSIFEARLLWDGERVVFGKTFLFHPGDAREQVLARVDRGLGAGTAPIDILFHLSRLHVKWHRFGHLSAAKIYGGDG